MDSKKPVIVKVKRSTQLPVEPQHRSQQVKDSVVEPVGQPEIELPEQPETEVYLESLADVPLDQSVYGSGWSIAELMNEFSDR